MNLRKMKKRKRMLNLSRRCSMLRLKISIKPLSKSKQYYLLTPAYRVVLQRQFFEAIVRAASVKYSNKAELPTLADKLENLFKVKLSTNASKNKAKSLDEEVNLKFNRLLLCS
jgi:hypothetical protein